MEKIKIAFDVHGVITSDIDRYRELMSNLVKSELFEVWVISGPRAVCVIKELSEYGIILEYHYHKIDTIVDYLRRKNRPFKLKYKNGIEHYYFDSTEWNIAKSEMCKVYNIHILIDDTKVYQEYFDKIDTHFILKD